MCHLMVNWWFRPLRNNPYGHFGIYIRFLGCIPPGKDRWRSPLPLVLGNPCARKQARASELGSGERRSPSTFTFCVFKFTWQTMPCGLSKWPLLQIPLNESFGGIETTHGVWVPGSPEFVVFLTKVESRKRTSRKCFPGKWEPSWIMTR